jgi:predicted permease
MFALADPFLWRPLPFRDPDRLAVIQLDSKGLTEGVPVPTLDDWRGRTDLFEAVAATGEYSTIRLNREGGTLAVTALDATANLFSVLGVHTPWVSAWEVRADPTMQRLVLVDRRRQGFAEALNAVGATLAIQGGGRGQLLGVLPRWFVIPADRFTRVAPPDALKRIEGGPIVSVTRWSNEGRPSQTRFLNVIARLRPGVTPTVVESALAVPLPSGDALRVNARSATDLMKARLRPLALGAFCAGLLILIITAANVANLMIVRGVFRERELATRQALGATRWDLARLVLMELWFIALSGTAAGLSVTAVALSIADSVMPVQYAALGAPAITYRVVAFGAAMTSIVMATGLSATLALRRVTPRTLMSHRASADARGVRTVRFIMTAAQSAVAIVLVIGAAFLIRSYLNLTGQTLGYEGDVVAIAVSYDDERRRESIGDSVTAAIDALRRIPGVSASAAATGAMADGYMSMTIWRHPAGRPSPVSLKAISTGYLETTGTRLIAGRPLTSTDPAQPRVLVNRTLATTIGPAMDAVGRPLRLMGRADDAVIVGVVEDSFDRELDRAPMPTVYTPLESPEEALRVTYVLRTDRAPDDIYAEARQVFARLDPSAVVLEASRMHDRLADSIRDRSFAALAISFFAVAGAVVSLTGVVAMVLFVIARRTRELAIRVTLGATPSVVRRLVVSEVVVAALTGLVVGATASYWLSRSLEALLFQVAIGDMSTILSGAGFMTATAVIAAMLAARRATGMLPAEALRAE